MGNLPLPRLLYIDDDERDAAVLGFALAESTQFRHAASLVQAQSLVKTDVFDLVLCKQQMKDGSGLDFLTQLQQAGNAAFRVILPGIAGRESLHRSLDQGIVNYCLRKPARVSELRMLLSQVMDRDSLKRQNRELMTAMEQMDQELEMALALCRWLVEQTPYPMLVCERTGLIRLANRQAEQFGLGKAAGLPGGMAGELLGLDWNRLVTGFNELLAPEIEARGSGGELRLRRLEAPHGGLILVSLALTESSQEARLDP